jgi:hypothetical protein
MFDKNLQTQRPPVPSGANPIGEAWHPSNSSDTRAREPDVPSQLPSGSFWGTEVTVEGEVRGFQTRTENKGRDAGNLIVWTFRLQRYDNSGNELPPLPVEMRGKHFDGFINEGDKVQVQGRWKEGRTVRVKRVHNLTTNVVVKSHTWW